MDLKKYLRKYKTEVVISLLLVMLGAAATAMIPKLAGIIINEGVGKQNFSAVYKYGGITIFVSLIGLTLGVAGARYTSRAVHRFGADLRREFYGKIQTLSFGDLDRISVPGLITRTTKDINFMSSLAWVYLRMGPRPPIMLATALVMEFRINWRLTLIFLSLMPFFVFFVYKGLQKIREVMPLNKALEDKMNGRVKEAFLSGQAIKSFVTEEHENKRFGEVVADYRKSEESIYGIFVLASPVIRTFHFLSLLLLIIFGSREVEMQRMLVGDLFTFIMYSTTVIFSLMHTTRLFLDISRYKVINERLSEVFEADDEFADSEDGLRAAANFDLELDDVSFIYPGMRREVLKDIDLEIKAGEEIAVIGETGSGKSSLVQLLPRLYDPNEGTIKLGGKDLKEYNMRWLRDKINIILQQNTLFSGTVRENMQWGDPDAGDAEIVRALEIADAAEFILDKGEGLDMNVEQGGANFSGGQRQRLCIARSILKKPAIMIFDDSTSALDMSTAKRILENLAKEYGGEDRSLTRIIISQRIDAIKDADKIIVLDKGRVTGFDTHDELLENNEAYQEIYQSQQKGLAV